MNETDIAKRIKKLKKDNHLSNEELARLAGLPLSSVSKLLAGITKMPTLITIQKIADALNVSIDFLVYGNKCNSMQTRDTKEFQILEVYRNLSNSGQETYMSMNRIFGTSEEYKKDK